MRHTVPFADHSEAQLPREQYPPCWVSACSRGDTTLDGGFSRMTLLVTENASLTVWISSCPWPWDSSLLPKRNQGKELRSKPTINYLHSIQRGNPPELQDIFTQKAAQTATAHSPAGLGGHYHVNGVHPNSHDVNDSLPCLRVGQAEDAQGLQAGGIAVTKTQYSVTRSTCGILPHSLRK